MTLLRFCFSALLCVASSIAVAQEDAALASAVYAHLKDDGHPQFRAFSYDLNNDGKADAVVLLTNEYCGSGGCNMLIFQRTETGYRFVSNSTISNVPIAVLPEIKKGWHTLVVRSGGTGTVLMRFDGKKYPSNPSLQPKATSAQVKESHELTMRLIGQ